MQFIQKVRFHIIHCFGNLYINSFININGISLFYLLSTIFIIDYKNLNFNANDFIG